MAIRIRVGDRVEITNGLDAGAQVTVVDRRNIKTRHDGVPKLPGHYCPVDWKNEVAIRFDNGRLDTMFQVFLKKVN